MDVTLKIDVDDAAVLARLDLMSERADHMEPVLRDARARLAEATAANFASDGSLVGGWAPLTPKYAAWKVARHGGLPTEVLSGRLMESLISMRDGLDTIESFGHFTIGTFGTDVPEAKFQQNGTVNMIARKVVFAPKGFAADVGKDAAAHIVDELPLAEIRSLLP
jgi:phage gpG-like protein